MNIDEPLDMDKMAEYADQFIVDFTEVITSKPRSKEMSSAAVAALAAMIAIVTTKLVGAEKAPDIIALAVANALQQTAETRKEMGL